MKHLGNLIALSLVLLLFVSAAFAQSNELSATKPAATSASQPSTAKAKKETEKFFNIASLDALRSSANEALEQWAQSSRNSAQALHDTWLEKRKAYLTELNKFISSVKNSDTSKKAQAEIKRLDAIK